MARAENLPVPVGVMHLTDTLEVGGLERVAVNLANALPRERYQLHLCTTRNDGPLANLLADDVGRLALNRRRSLDLPAIWKLVAYLRRHRIHLLHAHGTALFIARIVSALTRNVTVIWHDHYGCYLEHERPVRLYRLATAGIGGVIAVNEPLANWARTKLMMADSHVWYVPNFICSPDAVETIPALPGSKGKRIVCVANLRPQKDHLTLVQAMQIVHRLVPDAHLILVGGGNDQEYIARIQANIRSLNLAETITWLGERHDATAIQRACDIGVLSSASEGLPLALIEYGMAGLPVVATNVGQCGEVLDEGNAGLLVPPAQPKKLAEALLTLLRNPTQADALGERLQARVKASYSADGAIRKICQIYDHVLAQVRLSVPLMDERTDVAATES